MTCGSLSRHHIIDTAFLDIAQHICEYFCRLFLCVSRRCFYECLHWKLSDIHSSIGDPHNQTPSLGNLSGLIFFGQGPNLEILFFVCVSTFSNAMEFIVVFICLDWKLSDIHSSIGDPHNQTTSLIPLTSQAVIRPPLYCSQLVVSRGVATIDRFVIRSPLYCSQLVVSRGVATIDRFIIRSPLYCSQLVVS